MRDPEQLRAPQLDFPPTVPELLRRAADRFGDDDYVVTLDRRCSFRAAERTTRRLAKHMLAAGVGKGTRIGIAFPSGVDWMLGWLAAARIGALPMLFSSTYTPAELRTALAIGDVSVLLAPPTLLGRDFQAHLEAAVPGLAKHDGGPLFVPELPYLRSIWIAGESDRRWAMAVSFDTDDTHPPDGDALPVTDELFAAVEAEVAPADAAVVVYTSGSAAEPKAVVHTHGTVVRKTSTGSHVGLQGSYPGHRVLCAMPFFWVGGVQMLAGALHSGSTIVCQERFDAEGALELIERERVTTMLGWSTSLAAIADGSARGGRDTSSLGSVPLPDATVGNRLRVSSRGDPPNLGMTETLGPHYWPAHFDYKIIDPATGDALPDGVEGEFCVRGYGLMAGLYKREREDVFDADGWFHTGDRSYLEDGRVFFTGRYTDMIKAGGANVAPLEVETVLQSFPEVRLAFVFGTPHAARGEEVTAVVVPVDGAVLDHEDLRERTRRELSAYKVPTRWHTISDDAVPWLASGKPDKLTLRQRIDPGSAPQPSEQEH
jgi:acyl-CoA synthetase (AMP-forming)/AMP-acid ligase II